jgi:hypothetical protein
MRRITRLPVITALLVALAGAVLPTPAAVAQRAGGCAAVFPTTTFDTSAPAGPVVVRGAGLTIEMTERFAADFTEVVGWLEADIHPLEGAEVCVFIDKMDLDAQALGWYAGLPLRAVAFGEQGVVALSAWQTRYTADAGVVGLIHIALWRASGGSYPQPFGDDVTGWYLGRLAGSTEAIHNLYLRQQIGLREPWPPFPWSASTLTDPILWKPEYGYGGAGDFTDFVVGVKGVGYLAAPGLEELTALDEEWRQALFDESGVPPGGSTGWKAGVVVAVVLLGAAVAFAWLGRRSRLRAEEALRQLAVAPAAPAGADPGAAGLAVRPSVGGRPSRRHPRVGGSGTGAVGRHGDDRDGAPAGGESEPRRDRVAKKAKPGDEIFRHPGFRDDD